MRTDRLPGPGRRATRLVPWAAALVLALMPFAARATAVGELEQLPAPTGCIDDAGDGLTCTDGVGLQSAFAVTTSPDGRNVYAASDTGVLTVFDRDLATGAPAQKPGALGCMSGIGDGVTCGFMPGLGGVRGIVVSPDGRNVYVAANGTNAVGVFDRDTDTGVLTRKAGAAGCIADAGDGVSCADGVGLGGPRAIVASADGANVYVASQGADTVTVFDRDPATGTLTQKPGVEGCIAEAGDGVTCADGVGLDVAISLALSPDDASLYVASFLPGAIAIFDRDAETGVLTQKAGAAGCATDTGDGVTCADGNALGGLLGVAVSPDGRGVYAVSNSYAAIAVLDRAPATGDLTQKAGTAGCVRDGGGAGCAAGVGLAGASAVAVSPDGANVYATSVTSKALTVFDRDPGTGAIGQKAAPEGCIADSGDGVTCTDGEGLDGARSPAFSPDGRSLYIVASTSSALTTFARSVPEITTSAADIDFGTGVPGAGPGVPRDVTVENTGTGPLSVADAVVAGADAAQFTLAAGDCVTTLAPAETCVLQVAYDPTSAGAHTAALAIESDDPARRVAIVALSGTAAVPDPPAPAPATEPPGPAPADPGPAGPAPVAGPPAAARPLTVRILAVQGARGTAAPIRLRLAATAPGTAGVRIERRPPAGTRAARRGRTTWRVVRTRTFPVAEGVSRLDLGRLPAGTYRIVVRPVGVRGEGVSTVVRVQPPATPPRG